MNGDTETYERGDLVEWLAESPQGYIRDWVLAIVDQATPRRVRIVVAYADGRTTRRTVTEGRLRRREANAQYDPILRSALGA